jgi:hypothetical protein
MHLPRPLFLSALVATVASIAIARADVTLEATVLEPDAEVKGAAPTLAAHGHRRLAARSRASYSAQADRQEQRRRSRRRRSIPSSRAPTRSAWWWWCWPTATTSPTRGAPRSLDSVHAALTSASPAAGPKGSVVSVVTYAESATVVQSAAPLADLVNLKLTPGPTGPKAARALLAGLKAGVAELDKLARQAQGVRGDRRRRRRRRCQRAVDRGARHRQAAHGQERDGGGDDLPGPRRRVRPARVADEARSGDQAAWCPTTRPAPTSSARGGRRSSRRSRTPSS